jgi:hypothetical protein
MIEALPRIANELNAPYWKAAAQQRLVLPYCTASQRAFWPPSPISPFKADGAVEWREADTAGTLHSRVIFRRCFQKPFETLMPYSVGLVQLNAGPRLLAYLASPDEADSPRDGDRIRIGFAQILANGLWVAVVLKT